MFINNRHFDMTRFVSDDAETGHFRGRTRRGIDGDHRQLRFCRAVNTLRNIFSVIYDGTQPNPTTENVAAGLKLLKENNCDSVISLGGGSPHDCAKGIALVAANGGDIRDYEGVDRSAKPQLPMIAINRGGNRNIRFDSVR